jgi:hypothetical protein
MSDKRDNELGIVPGSQFGNMSSAEAAPGDTQVVSQYPVQYPVHCHAYQTLLGVVHAAEVETEVVGVGAPVSTSAA